MFSPLWLPLGCSLSKPRWSIPNQMTPQPLSHIYAMKFFAEDIKTLIFDLVLFSIHVCQIKDLTAFTQWSVTYETHYNILFFKSPTLPHLGRSFLLTYVLLLQLCLLSLSSFSIIF